MARLLIRQATGGETFTISDAAWPYYQPQGYVLLDTIDDDEEDLPLYLTRAQSDLRYVHVGDIADPTSPAGSELRTFFLATGALPDATETTKGAVELATTAETTTGTDTARAVTPAGLKAVADLKAPVDSPTFTGTVTGVTATMVGLGNVNNTADTAKPVSTAQQTALDAKAPLVGVEGHKLHDGTTGGGTRPTGYARVRWVGGTARPTNMAIGDIWEHDA